ncbi:MAG: Mrp/NBP35 family ATP-binding protein [Clostridia bacterium]|nr:Mrp/NBP35 family ATP-binding protein [Clostridia bacterium]
MANECTHDCSTCSHKCSEVDKASLLAKPNPGSRIKKIIGVVSGKGGVGKSSVTTMLAVAMRRRGFNVGILDADATGPSIPKAFGLHTGTIVGDENGMVPAETATGIRVMSVNLLVDEEEKPVVWRGPVIAGVVTQFYTDVSWGDVDYLFIDMPPGTGDVPLTVFQSLPVDGIVIVTSPQELVSMIVQKALTMAEMMKIPVLGLVENFSYFVCPDCGKEHHIFGKSRIAEVAVKNGTEVLARLPFDPAMAEKSDNGNVEALNTDALNFACDKIAIL